MGVDVARKRTWDRTWIHTAADERAVAGGCWFDLAAAEHVRAFFARFLRHSKGVWAGQPFELLDWQWRDVIAPLFGWKRADGSRRYRRGYVEVPKKNGKSTLAAGVSLYLLVGDREPGAEVANAACDRGQAAIVFDEAAAMVRSSPELSAVLELIDSRKTIVHRASGSKYHALSADVPTKEGLNLSGLVVDELHAHPSRDLFDTLLHSGAARRQPLALSITTAGIYDPTSIGWEQHEYARQVLDGALEDPAFFAYIRAADPAADWTDPAVWQAANPSLGVTVQESELAEACRAAQFSPSLELVFRRYRLNQWTQQAERWLPLSTWDASAGHPINEAAYAGGRACGGIDLAAVSDLSAAAWLLPCPHDRDAVDVVVRCWLPEGAIAASRNRPLYEQWRRDGVLRTTPGTTTDYAFIVQTLLEDVKRFGCDSIGLDRLFQGLSVGQALGEADLEVFPVGMGFLSMAPLVSELERLVLSGKLHHGGHSILRWCVDGVEMKVDPAGNRKPSREHRATKIDALVAVLLALDRWLRRTRAQPVAPRHIRPKVWTPAGFMPAFPAAGSAVHPHDERTQS